MKLVVQRVLNSKVEVEGNVVGQIEKGFMVLIGVCESDDEIIALLIEKFHLSKEEATEKVTNN